MVSDVLAVSRIGQARSLHRAIAAKALGTIRKEPPERVLRRVWGRDEAAAQILKAAQNPTDTTDFPVRDVVGSFRSLAPGSAALKLFDVSTNLDMSGLSTIGVPCVAALPVRPVFVGEAMPAPAIQAAMTSTVVGPPRKVLVLAAVTRELDEASPETASNVVARVLADASAASIDVAAFDTHAADAVRPAGLLHNVVPITAATGADPMSEDMANLVSAIGAAGIDPTDAVFVAGPREAMVINMRSGFNFANPVLMSLGMPAKSVAAFSPAAVYSGYQGVPEIETRTEASFHFEDTNPAPIVDPGGTPAAPTGSVWQMEVIAIKVRSWCAWAVAPGGAQVVNGVNW